MNHESHDRQSGSRINLPMETIVYLATACLAIWFYVLVPGQVGKPVTLFGAAPQGLSPDAMPRIILIAIIGAALVGAAKSFRQAATRITLPNRAVAITCAASFLFAAVLVPVGFVLASAMTVLLLAGFLGGRQPIGLALSGIAVPLAIYLIFTRVLHIALPVGFAGF